MLSTVGLVQDSNSIPRIRGYARVQNFQGIGFSVDGVPPDYTEDGASVIGVKTGVDANGIRYQTNCFVGQHSENFYTDPLRTLPGTVSIILERKNGGYLDHVDVTVEHGRLYRVLDVFAAAGQPDVFRDGMRVRFRADGEGQYMPFFAFCTVQENRNFSASFDLVGSEIARFRPSGLTPDSINCFVDSSKMWVRVVGYYNPFDPVSTQVSETGRIRLRQGRSFGDGDVEVGLKAGEDFANGYLMCLSGNGISSLVRVL